ncbi:lipase maturation factor 1-like [Pyxicephalus adspersus]|uniref:lipase maturation factor 1-like n=1 Tax=Pyxicephalus adspersus TaxID=30357 RepID=UPI003B598821
MSNLCFSGPLPLAPRTFLVICNGHIPPIVQQWVILRTGTFWLTRIVLLRALCAIYFVAFLVAFHQNKQLIGEKGLLPCKIYLENIKAYCGGKIGMEAFSYAPTVLWLLDWTHMDTHLDNIALAGLGISAFVILTGCANMILMTTLWILYHSLVAVGQRWYSFGK